MTPDTDRNGEGNLTRLVRAYQDGDSAAGRALITHTYQRFRRLTGRMLDGFPALRRWEQTDDVCQEAMVRLLNALEDVRPESSAHYLRLGALQIRRELYDLARHYFGPRGPATHHDSAPAGASPSGSATDPLDRPCAGAVGPSTMAEWIELHEAVAGLPEDLQAVVELHWYQGLPQGHVAEALEVDVRTVRRRWQDARRALARRLGGLPEEPARA